MAILLVLIWRAGGFKTLIQVERPGLQATRVALSSLEVAMFYAAVVYLPLADVMTYWLAAPIYVAALSPFLLGEKVGWRRWTAIVIGFIGVVIALDPSSATLSAPALISIVGSLCFAFMVMSGRSLRGTPDLTLVFWQTIGAALVGIVGLPFFGFVTPSVGDFALLSLLGIVAMAAHVCVNRSLKLADASTVIPFQYTLLIWAVVFGYLVFGDIPRPAVIIGGIIIVASGLFIFFREKKVKGEASGMAGEDVV
jgi:drug/metabolite transporter (DMT)-like permease